MGIIARFFWFVLGSLWLAGTAGVAGMAILALFGFFSPVLDLFNHGQPVLFWTLLLLVPLTPLALRGPLSRPLGLALAATGLVASSIVYVPEFVSGFSGHAPEPRDGRPVLTLMTFNVFGRNERTEALRDSILAVDADIVALQEYSPGVRRVIHDDLAAHYPHFQYCAGGQRAFVGLYARIPFAPLDADACSASALSTDRTARIIVRFAPETGAPFSIATTHNDWPAPVTRQAEQFAALRDALATVTPPVILAGDFNSTPWSYGLRRFVSEAGMVRHTRNLPTFPTLWYYLGGWRPTLPILPIDHVMTRGDVLVHGLETGEPAGSDHLPIIVRFSVE